MTDPEQAPQRGDITTEFIRQQGGFELAEIYPAGALTDGLTGKAYFQCLAELRERYGERNVISSFVVREGVACFGIFVRPPDSEPLTNPYNHIYVSPEHVARQAVMRRAPHPRGRHVAEPE